MNLLFKILKIICFIKMSDNSISTFFLSFLRCTDFCAASGTVCVAVNVPRGIPFRVAQKPDAVGTLAAEKMS